MKVRSIKLSSENTEEYIESIYKLEHEGRPPNLKRLSDYLHLAPATVLEKVKRLIKLGLARQTTKKDILLTMAGKKQAVEVIRKHRLAERFLVDVLGLPWDEVHDDACRFEHSMSDKVADALEKFLSYPANCPHGYPIPNKAGKMKEEKDLRLSELNACESCEIVRVAENSPELLRHIATLGLIPRTKVTVEQVAPFNGAFLVRVNESHYALGREVADGIWVKKEAK
jgi:DtxR family transcriptional regulator, Mn-dependent transcriptional regulator